MQLPTLVRLPTTLTVLPLLNAQVPQDMHLQLYSFDSLEPRSC